MRNFSLRYPILDWSSFQPPQTSTSDISELYAQTGLKSSTVRVSQLPAANLGRNTLSTSCLAPLLHTYTCRLRTGCWNGYQKVLHRNGLVGNGRRGFRGGRSCSKLNIGIAGSWYVVGSLLLPHPCALHALCLVFIFVLVL